MSAAERRTAPRGNGAAVNGQPAKKPEDVEKNPKRVEELTKKYQVIVGEAVPEDLRAAVIIDSGSGDL